MPPRRKPARFLLLEVYKELGRISGAGAGLGAGVLTCRQPSANRGIIKQSVAQGAGYAVNERKKPVR